MKSARQIKDLINNLAKSKEINAQVLLRNYMLERLLERISMSSYQDKFILKGGMLIASIVGIDARSTIDMDATIKRFALTKQTLNKAFEEIIAIEIDDGIDIEISKIDKIREEVDYNGYRVSLIANIGKTRIPIKVDVTSGDKITPKEVTYEYTLLLDGRTISILSYNLETVLAEKMETILTRSIFNTRMRDFYDIYILVETKMKLINKSDLKEAFYHTCKSRNSENLINSSDKIVADVFVNEHMKKLWSNYVVVNTYAEGIEWEEVRVRVLTLFDCV